MIRKLNIILVCCLVTAGLSSCAMDMFDLIRPEDKGGNIILKVSADNEPLTRADDNSAERVIDHLDIFIFDSSDGSLAHYEQLGSLPEGEDNEDNIGSITLNKARETFTEGPYYIYLIANMNYGSVKSTDKDFSLSIRNGSTYDELKSMTLGQFKTLYQTDEHVHMSGLYNVADAPKFFLMDGAAYEGGTEPESPTAIDLDSGEVSDNMTLTVKLHRAAAKIVVTLNKGEAVVGFVDNTDPNSHIGYYVKKMPVTTTLLADADKEGYEVKQSPESSITRSANFVVDPEGKYVQITTYAYAFSWAGHDLGDEVRLIVNIPMKYYAMRRDADGSYTIDKTKVLEDRLQGNFYHVPISKTKTLERNTCYKITATVNTPGNQEDVTPVVLEDISYGVAPWEPETVTVGTIDANRPKYLSLNQNDLKMFNITSDQTIEYSSSSALNETVQVVEVYYFNKFNIRKTESTNIVKPTVIPSRTSDLSGKIKIDAPLPENNTIRYITLRVTNEQGVSEDITVEQYPLIYVQNIQGWYSYRDDFGGTTYESPGSGERAGVTGVDYNTTDKDNDYYTGSSDYDEGYFSSKYATEPNSNGKSYIYPYYYSGNSRGRGYGSGLRENAKIYHIQITTSGKDAVVNGVHYTIGNPRLTSESGYLNGLKYTDNSADNAKLVSPSFMIASRLGYFWTGVVDFKQTYGLTVARDHCANYVEVYRHQDATGAYIRDEKDPDKYKITVLDNWRLPTEAELKIIMDLQGENGSNDESEAIDYLLNATAYMAANGALFNPKNNGDGRYTNNYSESDYEAGYGSASVRCIRDAYTTPEESADL